MQDQTVVSDGVPTQKSQSSTVSKKRTSYQPPDLRRNGKDVELLIQQKNRKTRIQKFRKSGFVCAKGPGLPGSRWTYYPRRGKSRVASGELNRSGPLKNRFQTRQGKGKSFDMPLKGEKRKRKNTGLGHNLRAKNKP